MADDLRFRALCHNADESLKPVLPHKRMDSVVLASGL
jgi:hypothetical protein